MKIITRDKINDMKKHYAPAEKLFDGYFNNSELFYIDLSFVEGKYSYYFEFTDIHNATASGGIVPTSVDRRMDGPEILPDEKESSIVVFIIISALVAIFLILILLFRNKLFGPKIDHKNIDDLEESDGKENSVNNEPSVIKTKLKEKPQKDRKSTRKNGGSAKVKSEQKIFENKKSGNGEKTVKKHK